MQREKFQEQGRQNYQNASTSYTVFNSEAIELKKDIVLYILKQSILESGEATFELVNRCLFEKYHCEISDCFEKPKYLSDVLRYVYDDVHTKVFESIKKNLDKFSQENGIKEFVELLEASR